MNIEEFIRAIQKRPLMYIEALRIEYIYHLLTGFHLSNVSNKNYNDVDRCFHSFFKKWILQWIRKNKNPDYDVESFYWHHFIKDITESEEEAVELFFQLSEQFFEEYHSKEGFAADFLLDN